MGRIQHLVPSEIRCRSWVACSSPKSSFERKIDQIGTYLAEFSIMLVVAYSPLAQQSIHGSLIDWSTNKITISGQQLDLQAIYLCDLGQSRPRATFTLIRLMECSRSCSGRAFGSHSVCAVRKMNLGRDILHATCRCGRVAHVHIPMSCRERFSESMCSRTQADRSSLRIHVKMLKILK